MNESLLLPELARPEKVMPRYANETEVVKKQRHMERRSMKFLKLHLKLNRQARKQGLASRLNPERLPE